MSKLTLPFWNDCCATCSTQIRTVPRNDSSVLGRKWITSKCKCVRSYWRKASGVKGVRQRIFWWPWPTQAGTNIKEAKNLVFSGDTTQSSETCTSLPFSYFFRTFKIWYPQIPFLNIVGRSWILLEVNMFYLCNICFLTDKLAGIMLWFNSLDISNNFGMDR